MEEWNEHLRHDDLVKKSVAHEWRCIDLLYHPHTHCKGNPRSAETVFENIFLAEPNYSEGILQMDDQM